MNNNNQQLAALPRRSIRLATLIPASYWISIGYSELDAQLMEELQNDIKKYCDGSEDDEIELMGKCTVSNMPLLHHDMLLPHWKKFAKCLNGYVTSVDDLHICGIGLPKPVLDIIFPAFQLMNLNVLQLYGVGGGDGLLRLTSFLKFGISWYWGDI